MRRWQRQWPRAGTMRSAAVRSYQQGYRKLSRRQAFPPMPPPMVHPAEDEMAAPIAVGRKLTRSQVGLLDLLFRGMISIPIDCTPEEACRLIPARTDDRSFVALLNEAMAVVLPGEPIPRAKADRERMLVDAVHQGWPCKMTPWQRRNEGMRRVKVVRVL